MMTTSNGSDPTPQATEEWNPTPVLLRVMRHPLDAEREEWLQDYFGPRLRVVTEDVPYGDDPAAAVRAVIDLIEADEDHFVVAVEAGGPEWAMIALSEALGENFGEVGTMLIRQTFQRGPDGRVVVTGQDDNGRDILAFGGYEAVEVEVRKALVQRPLQAPTPAAT